MKLLLIEALAPGHLYSHFNAALRRGLLEIGQEAEILRQPIGQPDGVMHALDAQRYDAVVSFSSIFGDAAFAHGGQSLFDARGVKFVGWQLDHPAYVHHALATPMANRISLYPSAHHVRFAQAVGVSGGSAVLLPGAGPAPTPLKPHSQRRWPLFVAATWNEAPERVWESLEESPAKRLLVGVLERLMDDPEASLLNAFDETVAMLGMDLKLGAHPELDAELAGLLRGLLTYVRHLDRIRIIGALVDAGLPIVICGTGWRGHVGERSNVTFLDTVGFDTLSELYGDCRIALNLNASNGGCERALHAMMAGAAAVSEYGAELARTFTDGEQIAFFDRTRPHEVVGAVDALLQGRRGEDLAQAGHDQAMATAQWRHRAHALVALLA